MVINLYKKIKVYNNYNFMLFFKFMRIYNNLKKKSVFKQIKTIQYPYNPVNYKITLQFKY